MRSRSPASSRSSFSTASSTWRSRPISPRSSLASMARGSRGISPFSRPPTDSDADADADRGSARGAIPAAPGPRHARVVLARGPRGLGVPAPPRAAGGPAQGRRARVRAQRGARRLLEAADDARDEADAHRAREGLGAGGEDPGDGPGRGGQPDGGPRGAAHGAEGRPDGQLPAPERGRRGRRRPAGPRGPLPRRGLLRARAVRGLPRPHRETPP
mmetsp:Transcript_7772/g.19037  ORF Transcript_7772/g.19037 Transcript_7772/m.19037 type:complete len:215 (-) Transcript_7772:1965-2609(-)